MKITKRNLIKLIRESIEGEQQFPHVEYVEYYPKYDQVEWIFRVDGNEVTIGPTTSTDATDLAWYLEEEISPEGVENDALATFIENRLKSDPRFIKDQKASMDDMMSYMNNEYDY